MLTLMREGLLKFFFFYDYLTNGMHEFFCGGKLRQSLLVSM